jgi:threonine dehydrogenase-like Zn-dependent dehydrogenase
MTSYFLTPWQKIYVSDGLSLRELSLVEPLSVGFHAAARGRVTGGDAVLVLGCGAVGLGAVAAAAFTGAKVIASDIDDAKLALATEAGATHVLHSGRHSVLEAARELSNGLGPDVVIEAIGLPETYRLAIDVVAFTGRVVYVGYAKDAVTYETRLFVQKELDILGARNALDEFPGVIVMLKQGRFPVEKLISKTTNLDGAGQALAAWAEQPGGTSKILVEV